MKRTTIIMALAGGLALQAVAAGTANNPSATAHNNNVRTHIIQRPIYQPLEPKITKTDKIDRVGGVSSRPWAQTVGWASQQTQFAGDRENYNEPRFNIFWLGATPK